MKKRPGSSHNQNQVFFGGGGYRLIGKYWLNYVCASDKLFYVVRDIIGFRL
jgi:hypothetical protein